MPRRNYITAGSRRGRFPGVTGAPRPRVSGRIAALVMLAALAIRLASMMPGVPVLHWHGAVAVVLAGGGLSHPYSESGCGEKGPDQDGGGDPGRSYYCPADIPGQPVADTVCLPAGVSSRGVNLVPPPNWRDSGAKSPGPSRGPPLG